MILINSLYFAIILQLDVKRYKIKGMFIFYDINNSLCFVIILQLDVKLFVGTLWVL